MNKITLIKAMNNIDDDFIEEAAPSSGNAKVVSFKDKLFNKKNIAAISGVAAALVLIVSIGVINSNDSKTDDVTVVNPYMYCENMDEAEALAGFALDAPDMILNKSMESIIVVAGDTIEVDYGDDDNAISVRKAKGQDDISGDYNTYTFEKTITEDEIDITVKGNEDINLILWTNGEYTYSVYVPDGVTEDSVLDIVNVIK